MVSTRKIYFMLFLMLCVLAFNGFVLNIFNYSNIQVVFFLVLFIVSVILLGFEKEKSLFDTIGLLQSIFIYEFLYLLFIYMIGLITGYVKTIYNLSFLSIIKNITPVVLLIVFQELFRYQVIKKCSPKSYKIVFVLLAILFIAFDLRSVFFESHDAEGWLNLFSNSVLPSIAKNVFLIYLVYKTGYKEAIFYQIISELIIFVVPIYPDLGMYVSGVLGILKPFMFFLILRKSMKSGIEFYRTSQKGIPWVIKFFIILFLLGLIILVSGFFKYYILCLVSNSMSPELRRGDAVIVVKKEGQEIRDIRVGDVLVYNMNDRVMVHRVIEIVDNQENFYFRTKGDANDDPDVWAIYASNVIGIAKYKVPYVGYPSVWFSELGDG